MLGISTSIPKLLRALRVSWCSEGRPAPHSRGSIRSGRLSALPAPVALPEAHPPSPALLRCRRARLSAFLAPVPRRMRNRSQSPRRFLHQPSRVAVRRRSALGLGLLELLATVPVAAAFFLLGRR